MNIEEPKSNQEESVEGHEQKVLRIYSEAVQQHEALGSISQEEIKPLISNVLQEIERFEIASEAIREGDPSEELLRKIGAIWVFSGPGTYDQPTKQDRYEKYDWARNMDRERINYATFLSRLVAEATSGRKVKAASLGEISKAKDAARQLILESGPTIIYNGTVLENSVVKDVLSREGTIIPIEKAKIIDDNINNTVDQIKSFVLPNDFVEGKELAIVSHAPHLARIIRMINRHQPFPKGTKIRLFPLPTPASGKSRYSEMEIMGLLYYIYLSRDRDATPEPYSYYLGQNEN